MRLLKGVWGKLLAQVPGNLRSGAEKLSGRWSQKLPPHMRNRGNTKEIVSEDSKIASLSLQGFLGAGREASIFVERERDGGAARHNYNLDSCSSRLRAIGFTAGEQELKTFTIFSV